MKSPFAKPRRWLRPKKEKPSKPEGRYIFDIGSKHYELEGRFVQDAESPSDDGLRWIATKESNRIIRWIVNSLANSYCQVRKGRQCWKFTPLDRGHPHHVIHKKMGGACTDDRIFLKIGGEQVQIRVWSCPFCHQEHHGRLAWGESQAAEEGAA
jgi:hypothetical protein